MGLQSYYVGLQNCTPPSSPRFHEEIESPLKNVFVNNLTSVVTAPFWCTHNTNVNTSHSAHHAKIAYGENKTLYSLCVVSLYVSKLC